ncbi:bacteriophytochrome BphP [soil metagenome]
MTDMTAAPLSVGDGGPIDERATLETCASEPIHVPGAIQPVGALLAFDLERRLTHYSANAEDLLGVHPRLGEQLDDTHFADCPAVRTALEECFAESAHDAMASASCQVSVNGATFDLVIHTANDHLIAEFERRDMSFDDISTYALIAHRAMLKLKWQASEDELLRVAVDEVRKLTGFDRVMAYRFRHDDSGDVVAEALADELEPYLGRRYPASDIPAQARRLYAISTLRIISDVDYLAVPLVQQPGTPPLDMSCGILRSVSPIHVEYLNNIGVGASMSVSIVVGGRLWGMLACHHMSPRQVPYSIRIACDVLARLLASAVQGLAAKGDAARVANAAELHTRLLADVLHVPDLLSAFGPHLSTVTEVFQADVAFAAIDDSAVSSDMGDGAARVSASLPGRIAAALGKWSSGSPGGELVAWSERSRMPLALLEALDEAVPDQPVQQRWCGVLALRFGVSASDCWLVALRREQVETVRWAGKPEKHYKIGPFGPRLTPRGSFAEWRETVRDKAVPWTEAELRIAGDLADGLVRVGNARMADTAQLRNQFLAILGHDLRGPLHAVNMAAQMLQRGKMSERMVNTIVSSSTRMQRLVEQMLDLSRVENKLGLGLQRRQTDLVAVIRELVDESLVARPDKPIEMQLPETLMAEIDRDRVLQMLGNMLSNAKHHGVDGNAVDVALITQSGRQGAMAVISISNVGKPIDPVLLPALFDPFKRASLGSAHNPSGMGLGLYIAQEIAAGHDGDLRYSFEAPRVIFTVRLALTAQPR